MRTNYGKRLRSGQRFQRDGCNSDEVPADDGPDRFKSLCLLVCLLASAAVKSVKFYLWLLFSYATHDIIHDFFTTELSDG